MWTSSDARSEKKNTAGLTVRSAGTDEPLLD